MSAASQTRRDLIRKMDLEQKLIRELNKLNKRIVGNTVKTFADSGVAFDASQLQADFQLMLGQHYERTAKAFEGQLADELPADIAATDAELLTINQALATYYVARSIEQASIITITNQKNIAAAILEATQTRDDLGKPLPRRDQAQEAGVNTARKLKGRQQSIAITETQNAAETAKATEAEVLAGKQPSVIAASGAPANVNKEWVTVGDENVRDSHVLADSQTRDVSKPYSVGSQLLRYPGDTSLGATAENVINCRCSSYVPPSDFSAIRRAPGFPAFMERDPTQQLLESLG